MAVEADAMRTRLPACLPHVLSRRKSHFTLYIHFCRYVEAFVQSVHASQASSIFLFQLHGVLRRTIHFEE